VEVSSVVGAAPPRVAATVASELDSAGTLLFEALRRHRLDVARREGIAPFIVASDRTLRDIARIRPRTLDELQLAHGIGAQKAVRYGAGLLEVVAAASQPAGEPRTS
jgi:ATP-dependent DNA helicase RecQ